MCSISTCTQNKCTHYWPDAEDQKTYGNVHVVNLKEIPNPHFILREFLVHHEEVSGGLKCAEKVSHIHMVKVDFYKGLL